MQYHWDGWISLSNCLSFTLSFFILPHWYLKKKTIYLSFSHSLALPFSTSFKHRWDLSMTRQTTAVVFASLRNSFKERERFLFSFVIPGVTSHQKVWCCFKWFDLILYQQYKTYTCKGWSDVVMILLWRLVLSYFLCYSDSRVWPLIIYFFTSANLWESPALCVCQMSGFVTGDLWPT